MGCALLLRGAVIFAAIMAVPEATAQQPSVLDGRACAGEISSLAPIAIPDGDAYAVDIFDPTELALRFRGIFLEELGRAGKATDDDGNLVFSFRSESIFTGITSRNEINPTYRGLDGATRSQPRTSEDETRDLIRSDRRRRRDETRASQQVIVEAELRNKATQRVLWLATVRCNPLIDDENVLMRFVSEIFIENLGAAVKQQTF